MSRSETPTKRPRQIVRRERIRVLSELADLLAEEERESADDVSAGESLDFNRQDVAPDRALARSPLSEAIPLYLASCKEPQTTKKIAHALLRAGRDFETANPVHSVRMALRKLVTTNDDIFHVAWSKWYLRSKCTKSKLEKYLAGNVAFGTGGHSKKEHAKRTSDGIKKRRSEGSPEWGPRKKATPEVIERAKEMMRNGVSLTETCRTLKLAIPTLYQHGIRQRALKNEGQSKNELPLGDQTASENVVRFAKS